MISVAGSARLDRFRDSLGILQFRQFRRQGCLSYVVFDRPSRSAMIIDPRLELMDEYRDLVVEQTLRVAFCVDTRLHWDHPSATHLCCDLGHDLGCEIVMSEETESLRPTRRSGKGELPSLGEHAVELVAAPGAARDSLCVRIPGVLFSGDALWVGALPRSDLPGFDPRAWWSSVNALLGGLEPDTLVYPGHAPEGLLFSTVKVEKLKNPAFGKPLEELLGLLAEERPWRLGEADERRLRFNRERSPGSSFEGGEGGGSEAERLGRPLAAASISVDKLSRKLEEKNPQVQCIDVREPFELQKGRIPGSRNIPLSELGLFLPELQAASRIYLYCSSGRRASLAARTLGYLGLDAVSVSGGVRAWIQSGFPIENS